MKPLRLFDSYDFEPMKKRTVITTETREVWVMRQGSWVAEEPAPQDMETEPTSESLSLPTDDAKKDNDSAAESTTPDVPD